MHTVTDMIRELGWNSLESRRKLKMRLRLNVYKGDWQHKINNYLLYQ